MADGPLDLLNDGIVGDHTDGDYNNVILEGTTNFELSLSLPLLK